MLSYPTDQFDTFSDKSLLFSKIHYAVKKNHPQFASDPADFIDSLPVSLRVLQSVKKRKQGLQFFRIVYTLKLDLEQKPKTHLPYL